MTHFFVGSVGYFFWSFSSRGSLFGLIGGSHLTLAFFCVQFLVGTLNVGVWDLLCIAVFFGFWYQSAVTCVWWFL
jgi:hypothetical protein